MGTRPLIGTALVLLFGMACRGDEGLATPQDGDMPFVPEMPPGAPPLPELADALTVAKVTLGKALFFDERLSGGNGVSCASCHHPDAAFSDVVALSVGAGGALGQRNAPGLGNVAYHPLLNRDGGVPTLHQQALVPITDEVEMNADVHAVSLALRDVEPYRSLSYKAYGRAMDIFVVTRALAAYERTLLSGWSRYDRYLQGEDALSAQELNGLELFRTIGCLNCHGGHDISDHDFHNVGLDLDHSADPGRQRVTLDPVDRGRFKTPSLRNVGLTGPYMHDGRFLTLTEVVQHFNSGGVDDPGKSPLMVPLGLHDEQVADLVAFLLSLSDDRTLDQLP